MSEGTLLTTRAGHTAISTRTLQRLVAAIAADAFAVPHDEVRADVRDEQGQLSVSLALAIALAPLADLGRDTPTTTIFQRVAAARSIISGRIHALAGTTVGRVDIRLTGALVQGKERVK